MIDNIGKKLKQLRNERGYTQEYVSQELGITRSTVSNYEIGRRTPHLKDLERLAGFYGAGLDFFGVSNKDHAFDLLARAREVFNSTDVSPEDKEQLHRELMRLYLSLKD